MTAPMSSTTPRQTAHERLSLGRMAQGAISGRSPAAAWLGHRAPPRLKRKRPALSDCYNAKCLAEGLGRGDEPYIRDRARALLTKLVDDNIRNQQSLAIVSELHDDPWATGCLDRLLRGRLPHPAAAVLLRGGSARDARPGSQAGRRGTSLVPAPRHRQAALQAAKGARVELLHNRKGPPLHTHTIEDGAILYRHKLTLRPDVVWNRYRKEVAQRILTAKPPGERETRCGGRKPER